MSKWVQEMTGPMYVGEEVSIWAEEMEPRLECDQYLGMMDTYSIELFKECSVSNRKDSVIVIE